MPLDTLVNLVHRIRRLHIALHVQPFHVEEEAPFGLRRRIPASLRRPPIVAREVDGRARVVTAQEEDLVVEARELVTFRPGADEHHTRSIDACGRVA